MKYDNSAMRRQDSQLQAKEALELLRQGEYGVLSMASDEGGYGVPVNYVLYGERIYFHCAMQGRKLRVIEENDRVSFCVVGRKKVVPEEFTTLFESVIAEGRAYVVGDEQERRRALRLIVEKYSPEYVEEGMRIIDRSIGHTAIVAIDVARFSGKVKR